MSGSLKLPFSETVGATLGTGITGFSITIQPSDSAKDTSICGIAGGGLAVVGTDNDKAPSQAWGGGAIPAPSGVVGIASSGRGVYGNSLNFDAIVGETQSTAHAGVTGRNLTTGKDGGVGIYGVGGQYAGKFDGNVQINGEVVAEIVQSTGDAVVAGLFTVQGTGTSTIVGNLNVKNEVTAAVFQSSGDAVVRGLLTVQGTGTSTIVGTLSVAGDIQLSNGDCAEDFDVAASEDLEAGTVVVLDDAGLLEESRCAYDRKVAGVISGAGKFKPGLILDRSDQGFGSRRAPVALVGKVFCKVDTQKAEIKVGDLLTTSGLPGHAMKAENAAQAFGAVIGKALQSMPLGHKGLIPILIALQ